MSIRARTLLLVALVAILSSVTASAVAVLATTAQVRDGLVASREQQRVVLSTIQAYGLAHGTWAGLGPVVLHTATATGQRVRLEDGGGGLIADSDLLAGGDARGLAGDPVLVAVDLPLTLSGDSINARKELVLDVYYAYRGGLPFAACLTTSGVDVRLTRDVAGIPSFTPVGATASTIARCASITSVSDVRADVLSLDAALRECPTTIPQFDACASTEFARSAAALTPLPARLFLGAATDRTSILIGPVAAAVAGITVLVVLVGSWLSARIVRPVEALASAVGSLHHRAPSNRVDAAGSDEVAALGRAFNQMADSLAASDEQQRRLLADVSHELRTPLANIRSHLEAVQDGVLDANPELVTSLLEEAAHQQRILDDLRDLAIADAGGLRYRWQPVDLAAVVDSVTRAHDAAAQLAGVNLSCELEPVALVQGDPTRIRQVISNFISNALRAAGPGGHVLVRTYARGDDAAVSVSDDGPGLSPDDMDHVFDRFWRADRARQRSTGGSGLGLAIARAIVLAHGGTVWVSRSPQQGAEFGARLPTYEPQPAEFVSSPTGQPAG